MTTKFIFVFTCRPPQIAPHISDRMLPNWWSLLKKMKIMQHDRQMNSSLIFPSLLYSYHTICYCWIVILFPELHGQLRPSATLRQNCCMQLYIHTYIQLYIFHDIVQRFWYFIVNVASFLGLPCFWSSVYIKPSMLFECGPPLCTSTLHPPDVIHVLSVPGPFPVFCHLH